MDESWNSVEDGLPQIKSIGEIVKVKLSSGDEVSAYFYRDKMQWIQSYGQRPAYFWQRNTKEPLFNVTHWKFLNEEE